MRDILRELRQMHQMLTDQGQRISRIEQVRQAGELAPSAHPSRVGGEGSVGDGQSSRGDPSQTGESPSVLQQDSLHTDMKEKCGGFTRVSTD